MKVPDKKYPLSVVGNLLAGTPPNEVVFMPDKIYFDGVDTSTTPRLAINEEYIRKDALIEWAKEKLESLKDLLDTDPYKEAYIGKCEVLKELMDKLNSL